LIDEYVAGLMGGSNKNVVTFPKICNYAKLSLNMVIFILMGSVKRINLAQNGEQCLVLVKSMTDFQS
jgi:hypothetical protein